MAAPSVPTASVGADKSAIHSDVPGQLLSRANRIYAEEERRRREKAMERAIARASAES